MAPPSRNGLPDNINEHRDRDPKRVERGRGRSWKSSMHASRPVASFHRNQEPRMIGGMIGEWGVSMNKWCEAEAINDGTLTGIRRQVIYSKCQREHPDSFPSGLLGLMMVRPNCLSVSFECSVQGPGKKVDPTSTDKNEHSLNRTFTSLYRRSNKSTTIQGPV